MPFLFFIFNKLERFQNCDNFVIWRDRIFLKIPLYPSNDVALKAVTLGVI